MFFDQEQLEQSHKQHKEMQKQKKQQTFEKLRQTIRTKLQKRESKCFEGLKAHYAQYGSFKSFQANSFNKCWFNVDANIDRQEFETLKKEFSHQGKISMEAWFQKYEKGEEYDYDNTPSISVKFTPQYFTKKD